MKNCFYYIINNLAIPRKKRYQRQGQYLFLLNYNSLVKLSQHSSSQAKCSSEHLAHRVKVSSICSMLTSRIVLSCVVKAAKNRAVSRLCARSFPLTSCAFSALFLSRCSIASCFHTFPHLRLSEATQNPCPLCRLSPYRGMQ